ncbi:MAG: RNA polymerase subunit sigma [Clostridiales bacterium]|nr:RNA polymerase subunit sigma [Clostridiales bacterium]
MNEMDALAIESAEDPRKAEEFIRLNEPFILKCASGTVHRYITRSDDEWSVALLAFSQALKDYSPDKGGFSGFARMVIRRRLVDYLRAESRHSAEYPVSPGVLDSDPEEGEEDYETQAAVLRQAQREPGDSLKAEIESANQIFLSYGFSFFDLADCSPKARKTKKSCAKAVACIVRSPILTGEMRASKTLPLKTLEKNTGVPRKILERHRKYIIAAAEIMAGDYPFLADYMRFVREELSK